MADLDDKAKAERRAAVKKRADALKKKQQAAKKEGASKAKKAEDPEPKEPAAAEPDKADVAIEEAVEDTPDQPLSPAQDASSLAQQSKGPGSPEGTTAPEIYKKQVARIEELEAENERLARENADSEKRWKNSEEALEDLREAEGASAGMTASSSDEVEKLRSEIAALERHNAQLQQQALRASSKPGKESSATELEERLASKSATMEMMELEMSKLRATLGRFETEAATTKEQVAALEEKLGRAERSASSAQQDYNDLRQSLSRSAEKAIREGSERTSVETKLRTVEHQLADQIAARCDLEAKVDVLESKASTLTTLHKEQDSRMQALKREKERAEARVAQLEAEVARLRARRSTDGGMDDDAVDELADEGRQKLVERLRELESENHDLRGGIWRDKRRELAGGESNMAFQDVDLSSPAHRRQGGGIGEFITSGINALTGADDSELLEDDDMDFDEDAYRRAQAEDAAKRLERIKEVKRGLKNWAGWRLDLVDNRRGGGYGMGEVFEI